MTRDDIIRMAREAVLIKAGDGWTEPHRWGMTEIIRFAALVEAAAKAEENEACARVLDEMAAQDRWSNYYAVAARAIRARGEKT